MKRSGFKRKEGVYSSFKKKATVPMKRTRLRVAGQSTVATIKRDIQSLLRQIVIIRDKKCILHGIRCNHEYGMEGVVWQAEHLIERSNSATYADTRLVVLVCKNCHGWKHFTKSNHDQYDTWVRSRLSPERVALWDKCAGDKWRVSSAGAYDWKLAKTALEQELRNFKKDLSTAEINNL